MALSTDLVEAKLTALGTEASALSTLLNSNQTDIESKQSHTDYGLVENAADEVDKARNAIAVLTAHLTALGYS